MALAGPIGERSQLETDLGCLYRTIALTRAMPGFNRPEGREENLAIFRSTGSQILLR